MATASICAVVLEAVVSLSSCKRADANSTRPPPATSSNEVSVSHPTDSAGTPIYEDTDQPPAVTLSGQSRAAVRPTNAARHVGALTMFTPIHQAPAPSARILGYLRAGGVLEASEQPVGREGCDGGWYRVFPFGFVCAGPSATTDTSHEILRAVPRGADASATLPYMYGIVRKPGPIYARLPTRAQATAAEPGLDRHMAKWFETGGENGATFRGDYWLRWKEPADEVTAREAWEQGRTDPLPAFLQNGRILPGNLSGLVKEKNAVVVGSTRQHNGFAIIDTVLHEGRRYAITTELLVLPVDRLRPIQGSSFHGYQIPNEIDFPFALVRVDGAFAYRYEKAKLSKAKELARRTAVRLTGRQNFFIGRLHFETTEGYWISDKDCSRLDPAKRMPAWGKNGERWIDINVTKQTLVAYEGMQAVFATLVSTGEAGLGDPEKSRSTKRGIFRIHTKHLAATMNSDTTGEEFELQDIPYVQYFEEGYALHAAYWHDDFGTPRSHGCINLAPEDARRLFFWTEPKLPPGWHSILRPLTGSVVFVHP